MTRLRLVLPCALALVLLAAGSAPAQPTARFGQDSRQGLPLFNTRVFSTFDRESGQLLARLFVQIVNDNLQFVKVDSGFRSDIQIEYYVQKKDDPAVQSRTLFRSVTVNDYGLTNSQDHANTFVVDLPLTPGEYEASLALLDRHTNRQATRKFSFKVSPPTSPDLLVSDLLLFNRYSTDADGMITSFSPELNNRFEAEGKYLYVYFNTFLSDSITPLKVRYSLKDDRGVVVQENRYEHRAEEPFSEHYIRLNRYLFSRNHYTMELAVHHEGRYFVKTATFNFYWRFVPGTPQDLDMALQEMRYIGDTDSISYWSKRSYGEKRAYFQRFWAGMDPNPDTEDNELLIEYFRRVAFANDQFSVTGVRGWKTDRGRIYIKFGPPDDIDRHPFEQETYPYVIWRYYALQKAFLFVDRTGFGDYVLHPDYYYVEYE